jgi:hypothetical protein
MNAVHVHLLLNHASLFAALFSLLILFIAFLKKNPLLKQIAMVGFVMAAVFAIPVYLTGEDAEHAVKNLPGVVKSLIEEHEEAAEFAIWLIGALGAISLLGLLAGKRVEGNRVFPVLLIILSLMASTAISRTCYLGGKIRHTEIDSASVQNSTNAGENDGEKDED